jgi:hypothetical protein
LALLALLLLAAILKKTFQLAALTIEFIPLRVGARLLLAQVDLLSI